jgi:hypothetical protein
MSFQGRYPGLTFVRKHCAGQVPAPVQIQFAVEPSLNMSVLEAIGDPQSYHVQDSCLIYGGAVGHRPFL